MSGEELQEPNIKKYHLRNRSLYGTRNFRIELVKVRKHTYDIKIVFESPKLSMPHHPTLDYAIHLNRFRGMAVALPIFKSFNNKPMKRNQFMIRDLDKGAKYLIEIWVIYSPQEYIPDYSAWQIFQFDFRNTPRIKNACVIDLGKGKLKMSVSWKTNLIEERYKGFIIELSPTRIDKYFLGQERIINNPRVTSFNFSNVKSGLEYRITICALFKDYENYNVSYRPYVYHTVFVIVS
ncbi:unnamed protein product [Gordionus sp. m RMFG-2023]